MESKNAYTPPLCVWKVIEDAASPEKHSVIRSLLGISKLEYAADLRIELETLIEIWYELNSEKQLATRYRPQTHLGLPEPPKQREMLVAEIHLLLENLRDKENGGTDFIPSDCNEDVINYTNHIVEKRTVTPTTPVLRATPNSVLDDGQIERVAKNIPVLDNETPIDTLREVLQSECDTLLDDIEYVRRCVEEGHCDFQEVPEPSLMELKRERKKLENRLIQSIEMSPVVNPGSSSQQHRKKQQHASKIRPTTPVPKRKNLPPVRPTSAIQYSASAAEVTMPRNKPVSNSIVKPPVSLLGGRSYTDPTGKGNKTREKELRRRNSASDVPHKGSCSEMSPHDSSVLSKEVLPGRQYSRIFCGTPDSGVSSRPVSELGMYDTAHEQSPTTNDTYHLGIESKQCSVTAECQYASNISADSGCSKSVLSYEAKSPQPPVCPRPPVQPRRSVHRTKFHKIKVPGTGDL